MNLQNEAINQLNMQIANLKRCIIDVKLDLHRHPELNFRGDNVKAEITYELHKDSLRNFEDQLDLSIDLLNSIKNGEFEDEQLKLLISRLQ